MFAALVGLLLLPFGRSAAAQHRDGAGATQSELENIVRRMEQAQTENREHYRAYLLTREYQFFRAQKDQPSSEVKAEISFVPPASKTFRIVDSQGSDRGEKVVRNILEHEKQAESKAAGGSPSSITRENYDFHYVGTSDVDGRRCFVLELSPKRKDSSLVAGQAWVDSDTYLVRKIEGKMARSPSWWVKDVNVAVRYGSLGGMWLQTGTTAVAEVRLLGRYRVISKAVDLQTSEQVARSFPSRMPAASNHLGRSPKRRTGGRGPAEKAHPAWRGQVIYESGVILPR